MALHKIKIENTVAPTVTFSTVKLHLNVEAPKANDAIAFYKAAFGAKEVGRMLYPKRRACEIPLILLAELMIGGFSILVTDFVRDSDSAPETGGLDVFLKTDDVSAAIAKAVNAGAVEDKEFVPDEGACPGGHMGRIKDPYGFVWTIYSL